MSGRARFIPLVKLDYGGAETLFFRPVKGNVADYCWSGAKRRIGRQKPPSSGDIETLKVFVALLRNMAMCEQSANKTSSRGDNINEPETENKVNPHLSVYLCL